MHELCEERLGFDRAFGIDRVILLDLEAPRIGVAGLLAHPDRLAPFEVRRRDGGRRRKSLDAGEVPADAIARRHALCLAPVPALDALLREVKRAGLLVVIGARDDHPVIRLFRHGFAQAWSSIQTAPSSECSFFHIGTTVLSSSMAARAAVNAASRCGAPAATMTAMSPMARSPTR